MRKFLNQKAFSAVRRNPRSKIRPPPPSQPVIRVSNHIAHLGRPKEGPKPRQLISLPPFPGHPLPGRKSTSGQHVTAISWLKYYFDDIPPPVIQNHFNKGPIQMGCYKGQTVSMRKIKPSDIMEVGARVYAPVSVAESKISKRFDDSAILVLNKPPKLPVKGNLPVHNSMDALAAAALSYDYDEGPKLVHRLDRESSGLLLMGRTKESISHLHWLFSDEWNDACEEMYQRYWALVIGSPKQKEGLICAPLTKVLLDDGETERVILANNSGLEASQEAITEYRVLGPTINGCSWIELRPHTSRKHQRNGIAKRRKIYRAPQETVWKLSRGSEHDSKPDILRFVASMPSHMKISWNLMSSYLV
ncbi:hypothetical protein DH2020_008398 [Rehmannia glutinosa]|uniref:Pseudouridine synthase RsuA/RluA-like domain-containing protein n=1 Tax=Rehmannia glutinosa TaxID=99300 RepID=A0ABR0U1C5_REHGL